MEPITLTAATIAALIIAGAANKVGETLVEGGFQGSSQLIQLVRGKFEERGKESLLALPAEYPVELQAELVSQIEEDEKYKERLEQFLESIGITYQIAIDNLEIEETIEIGNINLEDYGSRLLQQIGLRNTKAKNVKIDSIQMRSEKKTLNQ
jgi:hypothetical protein